MPRRPPFVPVMTFKILMPQALHSLFDEATEFQIKDRLSFQRSLGWGSKAGYRVPPPEPGQSPRENHGCCGFPDKGFRLAFAPVIGLSVRNTSFA